MDVGMYRRLYVGTFLVTLSTLMYEILLTRIFSVITWYHYAFAAISAAMFGMTVGGLIVYFRPALFSREQSLLRLTWCSLLFSMSVVLTLIAELNLPLLVNKSGLDLALMPIEYVLASVPFLLSGICVCLVLTRFPESIGKLYAADLIGAAVGCLLFIAVLEFTDALTAMVLLAALAGIASVTFARGGDLRRVRAFSIVWVTICLFFVVAHTLLVQSGSPILRLNWVKGRFERGHLYEKWNAFARIVVDGDSTLPKTPFGWGLSPTWPPEKMVHELRLLIDGSAATILTKFTGDPREIEYLKFDLTNLVHYIRPNSRVLVIGSGGGRDILSALVFGQTSVLGVEMNSDILDAVHHHFGEFTGRLESNPKVTLVAEEARSYIARSREQFDIIQSSMTDTWAATAAGGYMLAENSLYTIEALKVFLEHLTDRGVLTFSRWYFRDLPGEMYRLVSLTAASLQAIRVLNPRDHVVVARRMLEASPDWPQGVGTLLVSREPFSEADIATIEDVAAKMGFDLVLTPQYALDTTFALLAGGENGAEYLDNFPLDVSPPTDDRPFFFQMLRLTDVFSPGVRDQGVTTMNIGAVRVLGMLFVAVLGLTILCIIVPLFVARKKFNLDGSAPLLAFFSAIGFGFMLVEISQIERLMIFLGHPVYALSVVLFTLLLGSGLGSFLTQRMEACWKSRRIIFLFGVLLVVLAAYGLLTPSLVDFFAPEPTFLKILIAVAILFPIALPMGMPFPTGMHVAARTVRSLTAWLWGINGATSVCASVLAIVISLAFGISATFWIGVGSYGVASLAIILHLRHS